MGTISKLFAACLLLSYINTSFSKIYKQPEMENVMTNLGITDLMDWVCLIVAESGGQTDLISRPDEHDDWCDKGSEGCGIPCSKLLDDDITDDLECALKVVGPKGYEYSDGYRKKCTRSLCRHSGGVCILKDDCVGEQIVERINGVWACRNDPSYVWCCL